MHVERMARNVGVVKGPCRAGAKSDEVSDGLCPHPQACRPTLPPKIHPSISEMPCAAFTSHA